jgi:hypothetical protein
MRLVRSACYIWDLGNPPFRAEGKLQQPREQNEAVPATSAEQDHPDDVELAVREYPGELPHAGLPPQQRAKVRG